MCDMCMYMNMCMWRMAGSSGHRGGTLGCGEDPEQSEELCCVGSQRRLCAAGVASQQLSGAAPRRKSSRLVHLPHLSHDSTSQPSPASSDALPLAHVPPRLQVNPFDAAAARVIAVRTEELLSACNTHRLPTARRARRSCCVWMLAGAPPTPCLNISHHPARPPTLSLPQVCRPTCPRPRSSRRRRRPRCSVSS